MCYSLSAIKLCFPLRFSPHNKGQKKGLSQKEVSVFKEKSPKSNKLFQLKQSMLHKGAGPPGDQRVALTVPISLCISVRSWLLF